MARLDKIPLLPETSDQKLTVTLGGNPYILRVLWNERFGYFSLSVNTSDDVPILTNIKMVKNYPLIGRYKNTLLPFGDIYFIQESGTNARPLYEDLGVRCNLYYYEPDAVVTAQPVIEGASVAVLGTIWDSGLTEFDVGVMGGPTGWDA